MSWVNKKREMQKRVEDDDPILLLSGGKFQSQPTVDSSTNVETASNFFSINSSEDLYDHIETPDNNSSLSSQRLPSLPPLPSSLTSKQPLGITTPQQSVLSEQQPQPFDVDSFINNLPSQSPIPSRTLPTTPNNSKKNLPNVPPSKTGSTSTTTITTSTPSSSSSNIQNQPPSNKPLPQTLNNNSTPVQNVVEPVKPNENRKTLPQRVASSGSLPSVSPKVNEPVVAAVIKEPRKEIEFSLEMFEEMKKQLFQLEEENHKLRRELEHSKTHSLEDFVDETPKSAGSTKYDEYFEEEKVVVKTLGDLIREGLECNGLNKVVLEKAKKRKVTKPPVYKELIDEEEELINGSIDDEFEYRYIANNHHYNHSKELDAWCNMRRLRESRQKTALLKSCGKNYDVIIPIIISIEQSLAFRSFMEVLIDADRETGFYVLTYISFLKKLGDNKTLQRVFKFNNMIREEALLQYKMAISIPDPYEKMDALEHCLSFFQKNAQAIDNPTGFNSFKHSLDCAEELSIYTANLIHLTSKQLKIDEQDSAIALSGKHPVFKQFKKFPVYGSTLSETMKYCLFYHTNAPDDQIACPRSLAKFFDLSQHRFFYDAIVARSRIGDWKGVMVAYSKAQKDGLCYCSSYDMKMQKGNSGFMKLLTGKPNRADSNSILNIYNVMQVLKLFRAPIPMIRDLLQSFTFQKTEMELKAEIAKEYRIYDIAIQCIVNELKDRDMLIKLKEDINKRHQGTDKVSLQEEINNHLYNKKMKWKKATINI